MYYRRPDRIKRDYSKSYLRRQPRQNGRWTLALLLLILLTVIPAVAYFQYDTLQFQALDAIGFAPNATPYAADRAMQAQALYVEGNLDTAADLFELSVTQQPEDINYLYEYGKILIEVDRNEEARALGASIIAINPDDPRGYALKANTLVWSDPAEAIPIAITGRELGVQFAPLEAALAVAYNNIGRYQQAIQHGDLAIRIDPMDPNARRSYSYPLIFTGRYNEAIEQLETAISINPNLTAPYFELASLYRRINNPEMSVALYNRVLEFEPSNARAYLRLCDTFAAAGRFRDAEVYCNDALDIAPNLADAHARLGQLQYSRRNYESAIDSFETCVALGSQDVGCFYVRGLAHYFLGECDTAWEVLNQALPLAVQEPIKEGIRTGLGFIQLNCAGYSQQDLPTPIPPTVIPPTPIGGGF
ncbi:MAG: tetratricopeptide repeat protein [Aggregatilineales bacterium]